MDTLKPMTKEAFSNNMKVAPLKISVDYLDYFKPQIEQAFYFSVGPYYWFIGSSIEAKIMHASENIGELTPYPQKTWEGQSTFFFAENFHPEDQEYALSAIQLSVEKIDSLPIERKNNVRINIYCRLLDAQRNYRWTLIQMPAFHFNELHKVAGGLIMVTDLSQFAFIDKPMLTIIDKVENKNHYYRVIKNNVNFVSNGLPGITKREQEILSLMAKGLNTPQIAEQLFLAYDTVENHKRNMRKKTQTKTSAALMNYVWANNLL